MPTFNWPVLTTSAGPLQFTKNAVTATVTQDTTTPSNSVPLPIAPLNTLGVAIDPATSGLQTAGNTSLSSIDTKTPALGQALAAASTPVVLTASQLSTLTPFSTVTANAGTGTFAVSAASLPLPSGAASETTLAALNTKVTTTVNGVKVDGSAVTQPVSGPLTDTQLRASAVPVSGPLTDTQLRASAVPVSGPLTDTQIRATALPISAATLPLPSGAATSANQTALSAQLPATLGTKASAASLAVVIASDQSAIPISGTVTTSAPVYKEKYTLTFSTSNVTTAAYTQLAASTTNALTAFEIYNNTSEPLILATGAAAAEADKFYIMPGGNAPNIIYLNVTATTRLSLKALFNNVTSGYILVNCLG